MVTTAKGKGYEMATTRNAKHSHIYQGQTLRHSHPGGDQEHGYFGHPEDALPHEPSDRTGTYQPLGDYSVTSLIEQLQERGYDPQDMTFRDGYRCDAYDLVVSGIGTVRVTISPDDGYAAEVYAFDEHMCHEWSAKFSPATPDSAILGVMDAAEWQLAERRGGPVTPAQAAKL